MLLAVDEERWCSIDAAAHVAKEIGLYLCSELPLRQRISQPRSESPKALPKLELASSRARPDLHKAHRASPRRGHAFRRIRQPRRRLREWVRLG